MAEILPNQPIIFDEQADCWLEDSGIKVLAEYGDITQFQMALTPCGADFETVQDGNSPDATNWTLGADWSISGGQLCHSIGVFGTTTQAAPVDNGVLVRMRFTLDVSDLEDPIAALKNKKDVEYQLRYLALEVNYHCIWSTIAKQMALDLVRHIDKEVKRMEN